MSRLLRSFSQQCTSGGWETTTWNRGSVLGIKKNFFTPRTAKQWNIPREVVQSPSLEGFKTWLNKGLSNWVWSQLTLPWAEGRTRETFWGPFLTQLPYNPMNEGDRRNKRESVGMKTWRLQQLFIKAGIEDCSQEGCWREPRNESSDWQIQWTQSVVALNQYSCVYKAKA